MSRTISQRILGAFHRRTNTRPVSRGAIRGGRGPQAWAVSHGARFGIQDCFGSTHIGLVRENNEDQFLIADLKRGTAIRHSIPDAEAPEALQQEPMDAQAMCQADLLLVADGVGGNAGGELASKFAVEGIVEFLQVHSRRLFEGKQPNPVQIRETLAAALAWAQQRIRYQAQSSPEHDRMGTTVTMAYLVGPTAYIAHVGDSRAYLYREGELFQLTHDQTIAQMLADAGAIEPELVADHPYRNVLGSVLSPDPRQLKPSVFQRRLIPGDQLLLCTDGLTKHVRPSKIAQILALADGAADACRELIATANAAGGTDNITVVLAHFGPPASKEEAPLCLAAALDSEIHLAMA